MDEDFLNPEFIAKNFNQSELASAFPKVGPTVSLDYLLAEQKAAVPLNLSKDALVPAWRQDPLDGKNWPYIPYILPPHPLSLTEKFNQPNSMMELVGPLPGTLPLPSLPEYQLPYLQHPLPSQRGPQTSWGNLHLLVPSGSVDLVNSEASKNASSEDVGDGVWSLNPCSKDVDEVKHPCSKDVGDSKEVKKPKSDKPKAEELCEKPITRGQEKALEKFFKKTKYPTAQQKAVLTKTLKLTKIQVVNWFWNRRVKMRTEDELRLKSRTQDEIKQDELKLKTFEYQCRILAPSKQSCIVAPSAYHPYPMPHLWAPVHAPNTPFYHRQPVFHQPLQNPYYQSPGFFPLPLPHQPVMGNTGLEPYNPFQLERNMGLSGQQQF